MNKYKQVPNKALIDFFKEENDKTEFSVLEIGCNEGKNLQAIKENYPEAECHGVDILPDAIEKAYENFPRGYFYTFDIEKPPYYFENVEKEHFDYVLFPDVLEHCVQPRKVLEYIKKVLKPDGSIFITVPNLTHWSIMLNLIVYGTFTYTETGLLDYDHKHLFTIKNIIQDLKTTDFEIDKLFNIKIDNIPEDYKTHIDTLISLSEDKEFTDYETFSFMIKAHIVDK